MDKLNLKAMAKINIGLDVTGVREDGYHLVKMIMQTVKLHDNIELKKNADGEIRMRTNLYYLPCNENNLAFRAARMLKEEFQIKEGVDIELFKRIPVAGGMAGGSTDGAAVLYGMNRMFDLGLSRQELMTRGLKLGADVPFCIMRGTALAEGIGEVLTPLPSMPKCTVLIAKPSVGVSTRDVYEKLDNVENSKHPDIDMLTEKLREGDLQQIACNMGNILESVTIPMHPIISEIKKEMINAGAINAMMSGSGPTVFGLYENRKDAEKAAENLYDKTKIRQIEITGMFQSGV